MANQLNMAEVSAIETLRKTGKSRREIARLLGLHRETEGKYVAALQRRLEAGGQNRPNAPPGSITPGAESTVEKRPYAPSGSGNLLTGTGSALTGAESLHGSCV